MEDESKEKELQMVRERLSLYFEQKDLIEKVEEANKQFQQDFNELAEHLHESWDDELQKIYDFSEFGWSIYHPNEKYGYGGKYEGIHPTYWRQRPLEEKISLLVFFVHSTTTDSLRKKELNFRLRLPPQRAPHTREIKSDKSFNELFCIKMRRRKEKLKSNLENPKNTEFSFGGAGKVLKKRYDLKGKDLYSSYLKNLEKACEEFCENEELIKVVNECFEEAYREAFGKEPTGEKATHLVKKG